MKSRPLSFELFDARYFDELVAWYEDPGLLAALGPAVDADWLDHVLNDATGVQYSVVADDQLVAVVSIQLPNDEHPFLVITDMAINPRLRGQGIGSSVIRQLVALFEEESLRDWIACVDIHILRSRRSGIISNSCRISSLLPLTCALTKKAIFFV